MKMNTVLRGLAICLLCGWWGSAGAAQPMVSAGGWFSLALKSDGTVVAVGNDASGQLGTGRTLYRSDPVQTSGLAGVAAVAAGSDHGAAVTQDGAVWAWGQNGMGQLGDGSIVGFSLAARVPGLSGVTTVSAGFAHTVALKRDGTVWGWGWNTYGQLGDAGAAGGMVTAPVQAQGLSGVAAVAAGNEHTLALKADGSVWAFGHNDHGQLGDGGTTDRKAPIQVGGLAAASAIAAGWHHSLALQADGTVRAWGDNSYGQLGDGTTTQRASPVPVSGLAGVTAIAAGGDQSLALKSDGSVWYWGGLSGTTPLRMPGLAGIVAIAAGKGFALALGGDGMLWGWGDNSYGQLGDSLAIGGYSAAPLQVMTLDGVLSLRAGGSHAAVLKQDGTVWSWGLDGNGQLGDGILTDYCVPRTIAGIADATAIAAGGYSHALILGQDGSVWAIGTTRLAGSTGNALDTTSPVQVDGVAAASAIAAGANHSLVLAQDGSVWAWGLNDAGQVGDGSTESRGAPVQLNGLAGVATIAAGDSHSLALLQDGTVWSWGGNDSGQLGDGSSTNRNAPARIAGLADVVAIAAGRWHSLAAKRDGSVWAWGSNAYNQLGDGTTVQRRVPTQVSGMSGAIAIAAGGLGSVALVQDGSVWAWGGNLAPSATPVQLDVPADAIAVAAGTEHALALRRDGTVWAWGDNRYGALGDGTYSPRTTPTLVVNTNADGPLDLAPATANDIPANKLPPFYLATLKSGGLAATNLSASLRGGTATRSFQRADNYKVYVAALAAGQLSGWFQLDANRSWSALAWPMAEFMTGVDLGSQGALLQVDILESADLSQLGGSVVYLGYGTSADEMLTAGRYRDIYKVPAQ
jgi:alpha-tubulin suppressor-like RCC1 family protein